ELVALIKPELSFVAKKDANDVEAPEALYSSINKSTTYLLEDLLFWRALANAVLNFSSFGLFARFLISSSNEISIVTFIPPFRSSPKGSSKALHSLYVYFATPRL